MRTPLIVANWKMNNTVPDALKFFAAFTSELKASQGVEVAIAPPFTALYSMGITFADTEFKLAAQNIFWEDSGAFTGEIAGSFLRDVGVSYVIIGHSERRQLFGETDETVNLRVRASLRHGLVPVLCVGESLKERESGKAFEVVERQLKGGLKDIDVAACENFVVAYEPVWAIGTGKNATSAQAEEIHKFIRNYFTHSFDASASDRLRILYGGSVKPSNSREILEEADIDGALVGGASLDAKQFASIVRSAKS